jgi:hypothetical protein
MSEAPAISPPLTQGLSLFARFWGILTAPRETFADVAARPRWFGMVSLMVIVGIVGGTALMATDAGKIAALDAARTQMESFGIQLSQEAQAQMEKVIMETPLWRMALQAAFGQVLAAIFVPLILAGLFFLAFNAMLGGDCSFKQLFAVVVHASPVQLVGMLFTMPLMYVRESMSGVTNLGVFLPMLDERSFLARFFGSIDLIRIWWVVVLATGLSVLYRRKSWPIATALLVIYGTIAIIWAAVLASRAGA